jgi:4-amino-4-deoxy-L-arabinose transferase-like glycosyltransferase
VKRPLAVEAAAWVAALAVVAVVLPLLSYRTRDADSRLYAEIAARISAQPLSRWIAPLWPPGWYGTGYFREHPAGTFLVPTALAATGYPAPQSAYAVNAAWQIGSLLLLAALARRFASGAEARALLFLLQLIPIAFTYRVRANQEQLLLLLLLLALYATDRARRSWAWAPVVAGAFVGLVLAKGMVGLVGLPVCVLWLLARGRGAGADAGEADRRWAVRGGVALLGAVVAIGLAIAAYETLYRGATGESFLAVHLQRQLQPAMERQSEALVAQKAYNMVWYTGRLVWFPFPWSLTLLVAALAVVRALAGDGVRSAFRRIDGRGEALRGLGFAVGVALLYAGLFSLSDRRADRYLFPAYFAVAAAGAVAALRGGRRGAAFTAWLGRLPSWSPAALWLALILLHVAAGRLLHLPTIKVWGPDS